MSAGRRYWESPGAVARFRDLTPATFWLELFRSLGSEADVLDIGCGTGRYAAAIVAMGHRVAAIDISVPMLEVTKEALASPMATGRAMVVQAAMSALPFDTDSFDIVLANGVYHNALSLQEYAIALDETARVLRPGGVLCVNVFTARTIDPRLTRESADGLFRTPEGALMTLLRPEDLLSMFSARGFEAERTIEYQRSLDVGHRSVLRSVLLRSA